MEKMNDLRDLLKHEIEDLQSVEDQIIEALPKMIGKANNPDLKKALTEHLEVTRKHKTRLEKVMRDLGSGEDSSKGKKKGILGSLFGGSKECKGMKGIIEEGEKIMNADISPEVLDAAIIASAQKVEHYEICGYGTARTFARELGLEQVARQLEQTLNEEYEANDLLTNLAVMGLNEKAENPDDVPTSVSSRSRSAGRVRQTANREMEMEPVSVDRSQSGKSSGKSAARNSNAQGSSRPKSSGSPRTESGRSGSSSKKPVSNGTSGKTSSRSGSSSAGRSGGSKSSSRGGR